jgi:hypothetical protein
MSSKKPALLDLFTAKQAYLEGQNVTEHLRKQLGSIENTPEIIEAAYDLQAGTYIEYVKKMGATLTPYIDELACILGEHIHEGDSLLDVGTGELTTLSMVHSKLAISPQTTFAFDISWSRLYKGRDFALTYLGDAFKTLVPFVAEMGCIPLPDKSVSITTSSHALEPNGGRLEALLSELFRVTKKKLVLFEPCYEINTLAGQNRMDKLGYIKNMGTVIHALGGELLDLIPIKNSSNPLNLTACFVIAPPDLNSDFRTHDERCRLSVPGTNSPLLELDNFYYSAQYGLCFPVLSSIPILTHKAAILASAFNPD